MTQAEQYTMLCNCITSLSEMGTHRERTGMTQAEQYTMLCNCITSLSEMRRPLAALAAPIVNSGRDEWLFPDGSMAKAEWHQCGDHGYHVYEVIR